MCSELSEPLSLSSLASGLERSESKAAVSGVEADRTLVSRDLTVAVSEAWQSISPGSLSSPPSSEVSWVEADCSLVSRDTTVLVSDGRELISVGALSSLPSFKLGRDAVSDKPVSDCCSSIRLSTTGLSVMGTETDCECTGSADAAISGALRDPRLPMWLQRTFWAWLPAFAIWPRSEPTNMLAGRLPRMGSNVGTGGSSFSVGDSGISGRGRPKGAAPLEIEDRGDAVVRVKKELARESGRIRLTWAAVISGLVALVKVVSDVPVDQRLMPLELASELVHPPVLTVVAPEPLRLGGPGSGVVGTGGEGHAPEAGRGVLDVSVG